MRKLLLFLIVVSILACLPAALSWAVELNVNGDFRVRGFYNNNLTDANSSLRDSNTFNTERFILNLEAKSGQGPINVQGVLTTDFTSINGTGNTRFGEFPFGPASRGEGATNAIGNTTSENTFTLLQAYLRLNTPYGNFAVGRQVFKLGLGLIVADAVDAFVLEIPIGGAKVTLGDLKIFDSTRAARARRWSRSFATASANRESSWRRRRPAGSRWRACTASSASRRCTAWPCRSGRSDRASPTASGGSGRSSSTT